MGAPSSKGCSFSLTGVMTHGPSLSHPSQPVVTSRSYLRVYFAQISPFDFGAEMKAMKEPERLSPKFPKNAISEKKLPDSCAQFWLRAIRRCHGG